jgi:Skp family chaperone for outer membrane proteins
MKRRAFALALFTALAAPSALAAAQTAAPTSATQTQIDVALAAASLAALRTRYGDAHAEITAARGRLSSQIDALRAAQARHEAIDANAAAQALERELADVRARLSEFSSRCGAGHPDMASARARGATLEDAIAHLTSDGVYLPAAS